MTKFIPNKYWKNENFNTFYSLNPVTTYEEQTSFLKEVAEDFHILFDFGNRNMKELDMEFFLESNGKCFLS